MTSLAEARILRPAHLVAILFATVVGASPLSAGTTLVPGSTQDGRPAESTAPRARPVVYPDRPLAPDESRRVTSGQVLGIHVGAPAVVSVATGVLVGTRWAEIEQGFILLVEPGLRAGRLSAGYARITAFGGYSVRGTAMRTWHTSPRSWGGAEVHLSPIAFLGGRLGLFRTIDGGSARTILVGDVNFFL